MSNVAHVEENLKLTEVEPVGAEGFGKMWG